MSMYNTQARPAWLALALAMSVRHGNVPSDPDGTRRCFPYMTSTRTADGRQPLSLALREYLAGASTGPPSTRHISRYNQTCLHFEVRLSFYGTLPCQIRQKPFTHRPRYSTSYTSRSPVNRPERRLERRRPLLVRPPSPLGPSQAVP